jgi:hypothetical protein
MTDDERKARASIIQQIIQDSVFQEAVQGVRKNAIQKLVTTDPKDQTAIIEAQCLVKTVDGLCTELAYIVQNAPQERK